MENKNTVPMLQKALDILEYIGDSPAPVTLPELQRALEISQSSCFRIVSTLVQRGWLDKYPGNTYEIAGGVVAVAAKSSKRLEQYQRLQPALNRLANGVGYPVKFSGRDGHDFVNVCTARNRDDLLIFSEPGFRQPLTNIASVSTILLAECPPQEQKNLLQDFPEQQEEFQNLLEFYRLHNFCFVKGSARRRAVHPFDTLSFPIRKGEVLLGVVSLLSLPGILQEELPTVTQAVKKYFPAIARLCIESKPVTE